MRNRIIGRLLPLLLALPAAAQETGGMSGALEPGQEKWSVNTSVPPTMQMMMIYGAPNQPGPFIFRAKIPPKYKLPPHVHPDERSVTVLKGTYYSAIGSAFDEAKLKAFPPGSFYITPANTAHYAATGDEEAVIQEMGFGPASGIRYVNPADDPR